MTRELTGRHVAVLAADGARQDDLGRPRRAVENAGATTELLSIKAGEPPDKLVADASPCDYDALILSGGTSNPDAAAMDFVRAFVDSGKPVGVISHGPLTVVETGVVRGRTLTSSPLFRNDLGAFCREIVAEFAEGQRRAS
jgi:protease I